MAASSIGSLWVSLRLSDAGFTKGLRRARGGLTSLHASAQNWTQAGLALGGFSAALGGIAAAAGRASMALNKGMANVATLIPENTARVTELKTAVQDLAVAHGRDSQDLTAGLYQTISAFGDQAGRTMEILRINSEAAAAGVATTEDAIALTSAVTKAYGDTSAEAVQKASDLAFVTVRLGQTSFPELAAAIGKTTPLAAALGVRQEELAASYATLSGVTGTTAEVSTQLKAVLNGLLKPTPALRDVMRGLGVASAQTLLETEGLKGALDRLIGETDGSNEAVGKLFGSTEALGAVFQLTGGSSAAFAANLQEMDSAAGATAQAFAAQTGGVDAAGHAWRVLLAELRRVREELGDALVPILSRALDGIRPLLDRAVELARAFGSLPQGIQTGIVALLALAPVLGAVSLGIGGLLPLLPRLYHRLVLAGKAWKGLLFGVTKTPPAAARATTAIGRLGTAMRIAGGFVKFLWRGLLGPVGIVWALYEVVSGLFGAEEQLDDTTQATREGDQAWRDYGDTLQEVAGSHAAAVDRMAADVLTGVGSFDALADEAERVRGQVGTSAETVHAFARAAREMQAAGYQLTPALEALVEESGRLERESRDAAGAQDDLAGSLGRTGAGADGAAQSLRELVDAHSRPRPRRAGRVTARRPVMPSPPSHRSRARRSRRSLNLLA